MRIGPLRKVLNTLLILSSIDRFFHANIEYNEWTNSKFSLILVFHEKWIFLMECTLLCKHQVHEGKYRMCGGVSIVNTAIIHNLLQKYSGQHSPLLFPVCLTTIYGLYNININEKSQGSLLTFLLIVWGGEAGRVV